MPPPLRRTPELDTLTKVTRRLENAGISYMLTGSMAMNFHGHPRATNDFDIVVEITPPDGEKLFDLFKDDFYISREAVHQALATNGIINIIDNEAIFKVDLIIKKDDPYTKEQFERRQLKDISGLKAHVISPEDLILAKLHWSRESLSEIQERDVKNLLTVLKEKLDYPYMEQWANALGLIERLKKLYASH